MSLVNTNRNRNSLLLTRQIKQKPSALTIKPFFSACVALTVLTVAPHLRADVIPDGRTATTRTVTGAGVEQITVAAPDKLNASYNSYSKFNVGATGLELDNSTANAKTIVNEVSGTERSTLQGPIEITGSRANFILANPNGITIDGARFVNTGHVALGAGTLSQVQNENGDNVPAITASNATLDVQAGGLSGVMASLHLLAGQMHISGPIDNQSAEPSAGFNLIAGGSQTRFDPTQSALRPDEWAHVTAQGGKSEAIAIDIEKGVNLHGGKVQVVVTDAGAGVKHAGNWIAEDSFTLSADGAIEITGPITANGGAMDIKGRSINIRTAKDASADTVTSLESSGSLKLESTQGNITLTGAAIQADAPTTPIGLQLISSNDISLESNDADHLAILFAKQGDLSLSAKNIYNNTGRFISNAAININASESFNTFTSMVAAPNQGEFLTEKKDGKRLWYTFFSTREQIEYTTVNYGNLTIPGYIAQITGETGISITSPIIKNSGGDVFTNSGSINLKADQIYTEALTSGFAWKKTRCSFGCDISGQSTIASNGGHWRAAQDINASATTRIDNIGGEWLAIHNMTLTSPTITTKSVPIYSFVSRPKGLSGLFDMSVGDLLRIDQGGVFYANMGTLTLHSQFAPLANGGEFKSDIGVLSDIAIYQVRFPYKDPAIFVDEIGIGIGIGIGIVR